MLRITRIKAWFRKRRAERKLEKSRYGSWRQYKHNRDPDVYQYANDVETFYSGYPYVYAINYNHYAYQLIADCGPGGTIYGYDEMTMWCEDKIRWNYRRDIHRVYPNYEGKMQFNDIGGSDILYFAFKNEKDFSHFLLRWS